MNSLFEDRIDFKVLVAGLLCENEISVKAIGDSHDGVI